MELIVSGCRLHRPRRGSIQHALGDTEALEATTARLFMSSCVPWAGCAIMPTMPEQTVSVTEAARILGVSRRTVSRRIAAGQLPTVEVSGARRVVLDIPGGSEPGVPSNEGTHGTVPILEADNSVLRARLAAVEEERDHLRATVDKLAGTVDRLTISLAQLSGTVVEQRALEAGRDTAMEDTAPQKPLQRPWWAFWRRINE